MQEMMRAYMAASGGQPPRVMNDLLPFIKTPEQQAAFREYADSMVGPAPKN